MAYVNGSKRGVFIWLFTGISLVFLMVVIGGITRLTDSGLSITEWNVISGTLPPLNDAEWQVVFSKYKQSPEFAAQNSHFTLNDFKAIYWWEYIHRLMGRLIGVVFFLPFLYFLLRKKITMRGVYRLVFIMLVGGLQGLIGWLMVKSGLEDMPRVSHYRLALHLITALFTIGLIWWLALDMHYLDKEKSAIERNANKLYNWILSFLVVLSIQIVYGAFVAGLDAGQFYNTWPKMGKHWIAPAVYAEGVFFAHFYAPNFLASIQFIHRTLAVILAIFGVLLFFKSIKLKIEGLPKKGILFILVLIGIQFLLGVFTLILKVPVVLGVLHQICAVFLLMSVLFTLHRCKRQKSI